MICSHFVFCSSLMTPWNNVTLLRQAFVLKIRLQIETGKTDLYACIYQSHSLYRNTVSAVTLQQKPTEKALVKGARSKRSALTFKETFVLEVDLSLLFCWDILLTSCLFLIIIDEHYIVEYAPECPLRSWLALCYKSIDKGNDNAAHFTARKRHEMLRNVGASVEKWAELGSQS